MACVCRSGDEDEAQIKVIDTENGEEVAHFPLEDFVHDLAIDADGEYLSVLVGSTAFDFRVEVRNSNFTDEIITYEGYRFGNQTEFGLNSWLGVSYQNLIRVWNINSESEPIIFEQYMYAFDGENNISASFSRDIVMFEFDLTGDRLATMSMEGDIWIWDVETGDRIDVMNYSIFNDMDSEIEEVYYNISFHPNPDILLTSNWNTLVLWNLMIRESQMVTIFDVTNIAVRPDGNIFATSNLEGEITVWGIPMADT